MGVSITRLWHNRQIFRSAMACLLRRLGGDETALMSGGLSAYETEGLVSWLPECGVFVEFGTLFGFTARAVANAKPGLKVIAVDDFSWNPFGLTPDQHEDFTRRVLAKEIADGRIELVRMSSADFRSKVSSGERTVPDAVFFDDLHQYGPIREELVWAKEFHVKMISGHDYGNPSPRFGVTRAVDEVFGADSFKVMGMCWCV